MEWCKFVAKQLFFVPTDFGGRALDDRKCFVVYSTYQLSKEALLKYLVTKSCTDNYFCVCEICI